MVVQSCKGASCLAQLGHLFYRCQSLRRAYNVQVVAKLNRNISNLMSLTISIAYRSWKPLTDSKTTSSSWFSWRKIVCNHLGDSFLERRKPVALWEREFLFCSWEVGMVVLRYETTKSAWFHYGCHNLFIVQIKIYYYMQLQITGVLGFWGDRKSVV